MSFFSECLDQLEIALSNWDGFASVLPSNWPPAQRGVMIVRRYPSDIIDNLLKESATKQMTQPIISVAPANSDAAFTSLGGLVPNISTQTGRNLVGMRAAGKFLLSAWADQALGGEETSVALAGEMFDCMVYNCNRLPSLRRLRPSHSDAAYEDRPQLWVCEVQVEGTAILNYEQGT